MPKRMLIDAAHPEETRVVVINGTRLEEFDFESSTKRQVKGNIYLAKVTRVEPSLQAAFVDYGGNRHGFLAFSEIHPDYYRIPVGDRPHGSAEPPDGNGDRVRNIGASNGEDDGVPLASALPEPVRVPLTDGDEDDPIGGESDGDPMEERVPAGETLSRENARREPSSWENGLREDASAQMPGENGNGDGGEAGATATAEAESQAETLGFSADSSFAETSTPMEPGGAAYPASEALSAPEGFDQPVATEQERSGEAHAGDREPASIALRTAEESVIAADIAEVGERGHGRRERGMARDR